MLKEDYKFLKIIAEKEDGTVTQLHKIILDKLETIGFTTVPEFVPVPSNEVDGGIVWEVSGDQFIITVEYKKEHRIV